MLFRRLFQRARTHSTGDSKKRTCLCTGAKRDSLYDDLPDTFNRSMESETNDRYGFFRSDKSRRLMRQANLDESDGDDDISITEKLRRASTECPANIPMLVVVSFNPDAKGLQKNQIEIQRGYPVNAQFILNEWLFVKTADNEEGFVPYVCCRPMLRRQSLKHSQIDIEHSYKPYNFDSSSIPTYTPSTNKKLSLSSTVGSQSLFKRQDITSSSCGGDSGFSDCESSTHHRQHHNHYRSFDLSLQRTTRSSNIRSLRTISHAWKKQNLMVQDLPSIKSNKVNRSHTNLLKSDSPHRVRSQLSISSNSAFKQFVKRSPQEQDSLGSSGHMAIGATTLTTTGQRLSSHPNHRQFYQREDFSPGSSSMSHFRRSTNSCDEAGKSSSTLSSPYIRRTPFSRRSLPHHLQPVLKKSLKPMLSASPDPFQTIKKEQHLRHIVRAEPAILPAIEPIQSKLERHFSDLSLNQIENDSLKPSSTPDYGSQTRPSLSCSISSGSSSSSSASSDDSSTAFVHIHMNNNRCHLIQRDESIPFVFTTTNKNNHSNSNLNTSNSSTSFIHNVSITV